MNEKLGVRLGQKLIAGSLAMFVLSSLSPTGVLAADLSSTVPSNVATAGGIVKIGNSTMIIRPGDMITDAQQAALNQVLAGGKQQLLLNSLGAATGGRFDVMGATGSLVIPKGVMALQNISSTGALNLTGNLANSGSYYLYSTSNAINQANITAANILNSTGAILSTVLPSALMTQYSAINSVDLNLNALQNIINQGTISSSGNLSLTAGERIENSGVLLSAKNFDLVANNIQNSGLISALNGNININPGNSNHITFNNINGTVEALLGNINVRDAGFNAKANFNLYGGNVFAKALNINSGSGMVNINVNELTPTININGGEAHVIANTSEMRLGKITLIGDPTFYNLNGDIKLTVDLNYSGQDLALVASGNILADKDATSANSIINIDTSSNLGNGGDITLVAGAKFTVSSGGSFAYPAAPDVILTITGSSSTGGKIDFNVAQPINSTTTHFKQVGTITSASTADGGNAGNITMIAFKGKSAGSGTINMPTNSLNAADIDARGGDGGNNGNILVTANGGTSSSNGITLGAVNNNGTGTVTTTENPGNIEIYSALPKISKGGIKIQDGTILSGSFTPGTLASGQIYVARSVDAAGFFTSKTNGNAAFGTINAGGNVTLEAGSPLIDGNQIFPGLLLQSINSGGDINLKTTARNTSINLGGNVKALGDVNITTHGFGSINAPNRLVEQIKTTVGEAEGDKHFILGGTIVGNKMYVPEFNNGEPGANGKLLVVDLVTKQVVNTIVGFNLPQGGALSGQYLYVADTGSSAVKVVDTNTDTIIATIDLSTLSGAAQTPQTLTISGGKLYVLEYATTGKTMNVQVIDIASNTPVQQIALPAGLGLPQAGGIVVNPQGTLLYASAPGSKTIYTIDLATNTVVATIDVSALPNQSPYALAMNPTGTRLYVGEAGKDTSAFVYGSILVIDATQNSGTFNQVLANVPLPSTNPPTPDVGSFPQGLAVSPTGIELFAQATYLSAMSGIETAVNSAYHFIQIQSGNITNPFITPRTGPDGYGTSNWSVIRTNNGVPVMTTYTFNTMNVAEETPQTIGIVEQATIQCGTGRTINLKTGGGDIIANYDAQGGTINASIAGPGAIVLGNVGSTPSNLGTISAPQNLLHIGSVGSITTTGSITGALVVLEATGANADLNIGSTITSLSGVRMSTVGGDIVQQPGGLITGPSVGLTSAYGNIGTTTGLATKTPILSAIAGDSVNISNVGALSVVYSSAANTFNLGNAGKLTVANGGINAPQIDLSTKTGSNGSIVLLNNIGNPAANVTIRTDGSGSITNGTGNSAIIADTVNLQSTKGAFGSVSNALRLSANNVEATTSGSAYLSDTDSINVQASIAGTLSVKGNGGLTVTGSGIQNSKAITLNSGSGALNIDANIGGPLTSTVSLISEGTDTDPATAEIVQSAGTNIAAKTLTVNTHGNNVGDSTNSLSTTASTVSVNTAYKDSNGTTVYAGTVYLHGEGTNGAITPYTMTLKASSADSFNVNVDGKLIVGGAVDARLVSLQTMNSGTGTAEQNAGVRDIIIGGNIGNPNTGTTTISATNSGTVGSTTSNILRTSGTILSPDVELIIPGNSDVGSIGTLKTSIAIRGGDLSARATNTGGTVYIASTGNVTLHDATADSMFKLTATLGTNFGDSGRIVVASDADIVVKDLILQTLKNGDISIQHDITTSGNMTLNANGTGNIQGSGVLDAGSNTINLISGKGQIGKIDFESIPPGPDEPLHIQGGTVISKTGGNAIALNFDGSALLGTTTASTKNGVIHITSNSGTDIQLAGTVTGFTVDINSGQNISNATANDPKAVITAKNVKLTSSGDIGADSDPIKTKATGTLQISQATTATVQNTGTVTLIESNATNALTVTNVGNLVIGGNIQADTLEVALRTTGGSITDPMQYIITAPSVVLASVDLKNPTKVTTGSFGTVTQKLQVDTENLTISTKGKAFVNNNSANPLIMNAFEGSQLDLITAGDINAAGNVGTPTGITTIIADGNIGTTGGGSYNGKSLSLVSILGNIGSYDAPIDINATNLTLGSDGAQEIGVNSTNPTTALNIVAFDGTPESVKITATKGISYNTLINAS